MKVQLLKVIIELQHFTIKTGYITWNFNIFVSGGVNLFIVTERIESDDEVQDKFLKKLFLPCLWNTSLPVLTVVIDRARSPFRHIIFSFVRLFMPCYLKFTTTKDLNHSIPMLEFSPPNVLRTYFCTYCFSENRVFMVDDAMVSKYMC
ncbi:hypothetical protein K1719_035402 [Acacia pycnantha]|nr:hypothetical protein K1719_035402 [Acacia pycnantha]